MANSFILLADLKARRCSNSAEVRFAEVLGVSMILTDSLQSLSQEKCLKHQRKWKSVPNYTKSWYDRGPEIYQAEKYRKGHVKTVNSTVMARGTDGIDTILQSTIFIKQKRMSEEVSRESTCPHVSLIFMKQKRMSEEVSRESTCPHVSLIVYINVTYHVVSLCAPAGSVSASGMLYTGVKKLETVMVDAVCFSTFTSLLIVQS
ncbi:unnamed protein product [Brassica oleracea var. botrytis]|uniref:(rape) hypothetical protein n=1 Tax=Brassica napus TaxID=3708 RepID=A0A816IDF6_BRANA|nr:unnamed protein product [Brassica napus]